MNSSAAGARQECRLSRKREIQIAMPCTGEEEFQALRESLMTGWLTQGPKVAAFEKAFLERVLRMCRGNITRAAQVIGLDRANFYGKIRKYGINVEGMRRDAEGIQRQKP